MQFTAHRRVLRGITAQNTPLSSLSQCGAWGTGAAGDPSGGGGGSSFGEAAAQEPLRRERSFLSDATASEAAAINRQVRLHIYRK